MSIEELIQELYKALPDNLNIDLLKDLKRKYAKSNNLQNIPTNIQIIKEYQNLVSLGKIQKNVDIERALRKRAIRSMSGIVPIQVLMKPFPCSGQCIFCPSDATMPKSYINTEPGAMRALLNDFDPLKQVYNRLLSLKMTGHNTDKIEMIILGGSFDCYPMSYKIAFVKAVYDACNSFPEFEKKISLDFDNPKATKYTITELTEIKYPESIEQSLLLNETAENRIIGLTIETRPEFVTDKNCEFWRKIGVTRVEMGVQSLFDDVLEANKRGSTVQDVVNAISKMKSYGLKVSAHFMPGLYKSTVHKDLETMKMAYEMPGIRPDEIKFYPTSVIPNTQLYELYKTGEYVPLKDDELEQIITKVKLNIIPPYTRIKRLIRDIPSDEIVAGSMITNLRQLIVHKMKGNLEKDGDLRQTLYKRLYMNSQHFDDYESLFKFIISLDFTTKSFFTFVVGGTVDTENIRNFQCLCTRCREIRNIAADSDNVERLVIRAYNCEIGKELFISIEDNQGYLGGFVRLLLPDESKIANIEGLGNGTCIVRELHVYGELAKINQSETKQTQHKGYGTRLMEIAYLIGKRFEYSKISVISGIGVRNYYTKLGYSKEGTYMVKSLL
ncbi:MAG: radical SAM protein [Candidatus Absconditabacteria bacterium]